MPPTDPAPPGAPTRRAVIEGAAATGAALMSLSPSPSPAQTTSPSPAPPARPVGDAGLPITLRINGTEHALRLDPRTTLLDALREHLHLTGSKKGCDHGQCGACTVLVEGRRINACLALAVMHDGDAITTIEGLANGDALHPVQAAFVARDGYQCGYCTPGQVVAAAAVIEEARLGWASAATADLATDGAIALSDAEIRERMSGNLCRCGAYANIVAAVRDADAATANGRG